MTAVVSAVVVLPSCSSAKPSARPSNTPARSVLNSYRNMTTCGSSELRATDARETLPLLSCAGLANVQPLPSVTLRPGEVVTIVSGAGSAGLALGADGTVVAIDGAHLTANQVGSTLVTVSGWPCYVPVQPPPKACPLMRITVSLAPGPG
jgi:hypothetical protein